MSRKSITGVSFIAAISVEPNAKVLKAKVTRVTVNKVMEINVKAKECKCQRKQRSGEAKAKELMSREHKHSLIVEFGM